MILKDFNFMILNLNEVPAKDNDGEDVLASKAFANLLSISSTTDPQLHFNYAKELWETNKLNLSSPKDVEALKAFLNQANSPNFIKAQLKDELFGLKRKADLEIVDKGTDK